MKNWNDVLLCNTRIHEQAGNSLIYTQINHPQTLISLPLDIPTLTHITTGGTMISSGNGNKCIIEVVHALWYMHAQRDGDHKGVSIACKGLT